MEKTKISKIVIICIVISLISTSFIFSADATVQYTGVNVVSVKQARTNWCWAACAEVSGKNVYPGSTRTQYNVVTYIKGRSSINEGGAISEGAKGSRYVAYDKKSYGYTSSKWSFSQITASLNKGYAVQAGAGYYTDNNRNGGHRVVIYGTQFIDNSSGNFYYIDYFDPWDATTHHCTYSDFCDGSYNDRRYDQTVYVK